MSREQRHPRRHAWPSASASLAPALALLVVLASACSKEPVEPTSDVATVEVPGLSGIQGQAVTVGETRVVSAGFAGPQLRGRLLWSDRDGNVLVDRELEGVVEPLDVATCVEGERGAVLFATVGGPASPAGEGSGAAVTPPAAGGPHYRVHRVGVDDQGLSDAGAPLWEGPEPVELRQLTGPSETCVLCARRPASGDLTCVVGLDAEPATWRASGLGDWSVFEAGGRAMLFDWGVSDGRIIARYAHLDRASAEPTWLGGYDLGTYPTAWLAEDANVLGYAVFANDLVVGFLDGSPLENRVYVERLPLGGGEATEAAVMVDACAAGCDLRWVAVEGGDLWVAYERRDGGHVARVRGEEVETRALAIGARTHAVGGGFFRFGLSDTLGNWHALFRRAAQ
jgi:hypothetical protein